VFFFFIFFFSCLTSARSKPKGTVRGVELTCGHRWQIPLVHGHILIHNIQHDACRCRVAGKVSVELNFTGQVHGLNRRTIAAWELQTNDLISHTDKIYD